MSGGGQATLFAHVIKKNKIQSQYQIKLEKFGLEESDISEANRKSPQLILEELEQDKRKEDDIIDQKEKLKFKQKQELKKYLKLQEGSYFAGDTVKCQIEIKNFDQQDQGRIYLIIKGYEQALWLAEKYDPENADEELKEENILEQDEYDVQDSASDSDDDVNQQNVEYLKKSNGKRYKIIKSEGKRQIFQCKPILVKQIEKIEKKDDKNKDKNEVFEFEFKTDSNWPGSLYYRQKKEKARVKYQIKVKYLKETEFAEISKDKEEDKILELVKTKKSEIFHKKEIILRQAIDEPDMNYTLECFNKEITKYLCLKQGEVKIELKMLRKAFQLQEKDEEANKEEGIDLYLKYSGEKFKMKTQKVVVSVTRHLNLIDQTGFNRIELNKTIRSITFTDFEGLKNDERGLQIIKTNVVKNQFKEKEKEKKDTAKGSDINQFPDSANQKLNQQNSNVMDQEFQDQEEKEELIKLVGVDSLGLKSMQPTSINGKYVQSYYILKCHAIVENEQELVLARRNDELSVKEKQQQDQDDLLQKDKKGSKTNENQNKLTAPEFVLDLKSLHIFAYQKSRENEFSNQQPNPNKMKEIVIQTNQENDKNSK